MKIWIDADAAPREAKEVIQKASKRLQIPVVLVANQPIGMPGASSLISRVQVRSGANEADKYIHEQACEGDVVITADIPLAALLVAKQVWVIDPRGDQYTANNVSGRLSTRDLMDQVRGSGIETGGARPYNSKDKQAFASTLDRVLTQAVKAQAKRANALSAKPSPAEPISLTQQPSAPQSSIEQSPPE